MIEEALGEAVVDVAAEGDNLDSPLFNRQQ